LAKKKIFVCVGILLLALLLFPGIVKYGYTSFGSEEFCKIAYASTEGGSVEEVEEYYHQLEAAAPREIREDVAILRAGWKQVRVPLEDVLSGNIRNIQRPPEVSEAAQNVHEYISDVCGFDGGVYLVFPEAGF